MSKMATNLLLVLVVQRFWTKKEESCIFFSASEIWWANWSRGCCWLANWPRLSDAQSNAYPLWSQYWKSVRFFISQGTHVVFTVPSFVIWFKLFNGQIVLFEILDQLPLRVQWLTEEQSLQILLFLFSDMVFSTESSKRKHAVYLRGGCAGSSDCSRLVWGPKIAILHSAMPTSRIVRPIPYKSCGNSIKVQQVLWLLMGHNVFYRHFVNYRYFRPLYLQPP